MTGSRHTVNEFMAVFCTGRKDAYGIEKGGSGLCIRSALTPLLVSEHLKGTVRLGVYLLSPEGTTKELIIDIDKEEPEQAKSVSAAFAEVGLTPYVERSKSKGYHIRVFFLFPEEAAKVRRIGLYAANKAGIPSTEIFPKQDKAEDLGNYLYLPLHGESIKNARTVFVDRENGMAVYPDQWGVVTSIHRNSREQVRTALSKIPTLPQSPTKHINGKTQKLPLDYIDTGISNCHALGGILHKAESDRHLSHDQRIAIANYAAVFDGGEEWVSKNIFSILEDYDEEYTRQQFASLVHKPPLCTNLGLCPGQERCARIQAIAGQSPIAFVRAKLSGVIDYDLTIEDRKPIREEFLGVTSDKIIPPAGFLREYVEFYSKQTDAPKIYHLMMAYFTLAVILGPRVYFRLAGDRLYPNIWMVIIGGSSLFRKTTAINKSKGLVSAIEPKIVLPSDFTVEALIDCLASNPQGAFYHPEFRSLYGMLSKDYMSGAKALLTELYDSPEEYRRETRGKTVHIKQPIINMASATTTEWLTSKGSEEDFGSGYLARYLFIPAFKREGSMPIPPEPDKAGFKRLQYTACQIRDNYQEPTQAQYIPIAEELYRDWYIKYDRIDPFNGTPMTPFHARYQTYAHKLAMIYTASVGGNMREMGVEAVTYATGTIEWVTKSLATLYDKFLTFGRDDERMQRLLAKVPGEGKAITRSELLRLSRMNVKDFDLILRTLKDIGLVRETNTINKGHKVTVYCKNSLQ